MKVLFTNLHPDIQTKDLLHLVMEFGECQSVTFINSSQKYAHKMAVVEIIDQEVCNIIVNSLNGDLIKGIPVIITNYEEVTAYEEVKTHS